ncbi:hypothetical protein PCANC_26695 [Puccinia coronata f. sp. avenae]|uniref:Lysophospholipase n=1 Tax=Puccinia coronata f. sp. avenae TaxID=200324 RepID=A0A2N5TZQ0_9BASI|nr:hypothetical protein PCANC_26695 [Puccinia coronata f. sp. avenae]
MASLANKVAVSGTGTASNAGLDGRIQVYIGCSHPIQTQVPGHRVNQEPIQTWWPNVRATKFESVLGGPAPEFELDVINSLRLGLCCSHPEFFDSSVQASGTIPSHTLSSPHSLSVYDPALSSFISTKHLGTQMYSGKPINPKRCALNFDNAGFLMGVSSNLFPAYRLLLRAFFNLTLPLSKYVSKTVNAIIPNPFLGLGTEEFLQKTDEELEIVDGGFGNGK